MIGDLHVFSITPVQSPPHSLSTPQAVAFDGWTEAIATSRHIKQVLAKAVKRITNLRLSQVFQWWRDQAAAQPHAQAQAAQLIQPYLNTCKLW